MRNEIPQEEIEKAMRDLEDYRFNGMYAGSGGLWDETCADAIICLSRQRAYMPTIFQDRIQTRLACPTCSKELVVLDRNRKLQQGVLKRYCENCGQRLNVEMIKSKLPYIIISI